MADKAEHRITQESVDAFVAKLQAWAADLPVEEKAILTSMLNRAGEEPEVEGFAISFTPQILRTAVLRRSTIGESLSPEQQTTGWGRIWGQAYPG
jgi:hypothetical protein